MELDVGGIYRLERKLMKKVNLYERKSDSGRFNYKRSMNAKILVIGKSPSAPEHRGIRYVAFFFAKNEEDAFVDCIYAGWIKKVQFIKRERDLDRWPALAKNQFLLAKGASHAAVIAGTIEEVQRQIANVGRVCRLQEEQINRKRKKNGKKKKVKPKLMDIIGGSTTATMPVYAPDYGSTMHEKMTFKIDKVRSEVLEEEELLEEPCDYGDYDDVYDEAEWEECDCDVAPPLPSEPLPEPVPTPLTVGYMKKKKKGKKKAKKTKYWDPHAYATTYVAQPITAGEKEELKHLVYNTTGVDPAVKAQALEKLKEIDEMEQEKRKAAEDAAKSYELWKKEADKQKEETE